MNNDLAPRPAAGLTRSEGAAGTSLARTAETSTAAQASMARAQVEARFVMARSMPRDMLEVRQRVLKECQRTAFAEVARYSVPRGGKAIVGPSIRFAEAAIRCMGNIAVGSPTLFDDAEQRIVRCSATDLETNATYEQDITITKTVERRESRGVPLGMRQNSYGETVYIVAATDDEMTTKQAALVSKAIRTLALRLVPGDIVEEAMAQVRETLSQAERADPEAGRKRAVDAFFSIGVPVAELVKWLGHGLDTASPAEVSDLRLVYASIRDGEATWKESLAAKLGSIDAATGEVTPPTARRNVAREATKKAKEALAQKPETPAPVATHAAPATPAQTALGYDPSTQDAPPPDDAVKP